MGAGWCDVDPNEPVFTMLHRMQTWSSDENSVCPFVKRVHCDKMVERSVQIHIIRKIISPSFLRRRMVGGGDPFYLKFWVNRPTL